MSATPQDRLPFVRLVDRLRGLPGLPLVAVDGLSGSGKSWLADRLAVALGWRLLGMDDFVPGWDKLTVGVQRVRDELVTPLTRGETARIEPWDWEASRFAPAIEVPPAGGLILEGSGAIAAAGGSGAFAIWVAEDESVRAERLRERFDYPIYRPHIEQWALQERQVADAARSARVADLVVSALAEDSMAVRDKRP